MRPWPCVERIAWHRLVLGFRQYSHCRHSGVYSGMTWSPLRTDVTPGPTSTTTPAPSWPRIAGNRPSGSAPDSVNSSVWQTPVARISTSTSPARGPSRSTVSIVSGAPARWATAARLFIAKLLWPSATIPELLPRRRRLGRQLRLFAHDAPRAERERRGDEHAAREHDGRAERREPLVHPDERQVAAAVDDGVDRRLRLVACLAVDAGVDRLARRLVQ